MLDPSCGSGTFLFHAVRRYLAAADAAGQPLATSLAALSNRVLGVDLHPVAVALARVTYLLAIGRDRLVNPTRRSITVPVYLGDSLQWQQRLDLLSDGHLTIPTGTGDQLFDAELRFPDHLLDDAARFDQIVTALADQAAKPRPPGRPKLPAGIVQRLAIDAADQPQLEDNYVLLCRLHDEGRDHIWGYYVRNLARPLWLARAANRVDVLVGNPPWLSYRHMPADMQARFREMSRDRGLWAGAEVATQQDLSGLFVARAVQQYLRPGGDFAFVMPNGVLDRDYFAGFRTGRYDEASEPADVAFHGSWDLRRLRPHFFPRGAAVLFGTRADGAPAAMPTQTERWTGRLPRGADTWEHVVNAITREPAELSSRGGSAASPYEPRFANGATIFPRVLFYVTTPPAGPLGLAAGRQEVRSATSSTEKAPWKNLDRLHGVVESEFVRPVLLGESVLPYRVLPPRSAVLPLEGSELLHRDHPRLDLYPGLAAWWRQAEDLWITHRSSERLTLDERLNYRRGLTQQLPAPPLRVVYGASGMHVTAAVVDDPNVLIDKKLYWGTVTTRAEGDFLCAVLNSPSLTELVRPLMSYGKDERDIDKAVWQLPIPAFDPHDAEHQRIAAMGASCSELIAALTIDEGGSFITERRKVRAALASSEVGQALDEIVQELLA